MLYMAPGLSGQVLNVRITASTLGWPPPVPIGRRTALGGRRSNDRRAQSPGQYSVRCRRAGGGRTSKSFGCSTISRILAPFRLDTRARLLLHLYFGGVPWAPTPASRCRAYCGRTSPG